MRVVTQAAFVAMLTAMVVVTGTPAWAQGARPPLPPGVAMIPASGAELGVSIRELTKDDMTRAGLERPGGVVVEDVREGSPAARGGLRSGDVVVEFDGERVRGVRHFSRLVLETPPGRTVKGSIVRNGARQTLDLTPEAGSRAAGIIPEIGREIERGMRSIPRDFDLESVFPQWMSRAQVGMTLMPLTDQLASYFGVKNGVLVSAVEADSPAARASIRAGDILISVNGRTSTGPVDVAASLRGARGSTIDIRLVREKKELTVRLAVPARQQLPREREVPI